MANGYKKINKQLIQMTDAEQKEFDDNNTAWNNAAPARRMVELRRQRDTLLAETDYMALGDVTLSDSWKTYRQALRDMASQTPSDDEMDANGLYTSVNWPTKPS
tara:strand:+ start:382 stop:693 length:312 start_codon:yes stop_codon:yes gene_type:complete